MPYITQTFEHGRRTLKTIPHAKRHISITIIQNALESNCMIDGYLDYFSFEFQHFLFIVLQWQYSVILFFA
jgi:hypothetical protein